MQLDSFEAEVGDIHGGIYQISGFWQFSLHIKKSPRGWQSFNDECLFGNIDENGNVTYFFKKTWGTRILTIIAPIFVAVICLLSLVIPVFQSALWGLIPAAFLFSFNFIKPKKRRQILKDFLMHLVDYSNNKQ